MASRSLTTNLMNPMRTEMAGAATGRSRCRSWGFLSRCRYPAPEPRRRLEVGQGGGQDPGDDGGDRRLAGGVGHQILPDLQLQVVEAPPACVVRDGEVDLVHPVGLVVADRRLTELGA